MGIKGLFQLISDNAPGAIKTIEFKSLNGRKVAIDASMSLYQFLIAIRANGQQLVGEDGQATSHLIGMFYRTLNMVENGVKPMYVFDGKPPEMKRGELSKRLAKRNEAQARAAELLMPGEEPAEGEEEEVIDKEKQKEAEELLVKLEKRQVRVSPEQNAEAQRLLQLMGIPYIVAPSEAEAQCAQLAREEVVYAAASEDMDTLTFQAPFLLRHLTATNEKKNPVQEIDLDKALKGMELTKSQFIDLCILCGCDYCEPIRGVGPVTALKMIREHGSLDKIIESIKSAGKKTQVPEDWPFEEVRQLFHAPEVLKKDQLKEVIEWKEPDEEGLVNFLCKEKQFSEERVRSACNKLRKAKDQKPQSRIDTFFKMKPREDASKRKADAKSKTATKKSKK